MTTLITAAQLRQFSMRCDYMALAPALNREAIRCEINTPRRLRHWLANLHHESLGLTRLEENLNYSAKRLTEVWPKRFPTLASAQPYALNPRALAEKVYGGRMGNTKPGDGWKYRGRSLQMLTGEDNYARASVWTGLDLRANPDLAARPDVSAKISADFWRVEGLNEVVDADAGERTISDVRARILANEEDDLRQARQRVNGGLIGLDDVRNQLLRAASIWPDRP